MKEPKVILIGAGEGFMQNLRYEMDKGIAERLIILDSLEEKDKPKEIFPIKATPIFEHPEPLILFDNYRKPKKRNGGNNRKGHKRKKAINGKRKKK